ncbi:aspartate--tRNA ligase, mitochondrial [Agrilus planipennis]|uniref:Aspartate--tRNA ligase, mitochondrial n=1 Tax=Agrilus planipennis TaxID=224129 RepID=A0A1W4WKH8_AGRPL|nr:aspartate--tRNA ligase, mitochondrial [Agrilus planipennis]
MHLRKLCRTVFNRRFFQCSSELLSTKDIKPFKNVQLFHTTLCSYSTTTKSTYLIDEPEVYNNDKNFSGTNKFTERTHTCGELRIANVGQTVTLCGWLEYQRMNKFIVLRDSYGRTQLIIKENDTEPSKCLESLPYETILKVQGTVQARPENMINPSQQTGEIEVVIQSLEILNKADTNLPFNIREFQKAKEALRLQFRYLDLRFSEMQRNLRVRSQFLMDIRTFLVKHSNFVDVETPTLFKATPGGAQEFIVPTRFPGQCYALVQSPQQFKQMLMAGAIDRYFQIARCYRDESIRSDRQPEFTQLDIEMSFTDVNGILQLIEELLLYSWPDFLPPLPFQFPRISYSEAMETYGSDKPDVRYDFKLINLTDIFKEHKFEDNFGAYCVFFNHPYCNLTSTIKARLTEIAKKAPEVKFIQSKVSIVSEWVEKISDLLGEKIANIIAEKVKLENDSVIFLAYGDKHAVLPLLGHVRVEYAKHMEKRGHKIVNDGMFPLWVIDFPLFEKGELSGQFNSAHHPFTAPQKRDEHLLHTNPLQVRAQAFDLVLNGNEVGGGSIRIHDSQKQEEILNILGIPKTSLKHMLMMLRSGCPPHGGIALGIDRLLATMLNTSSIRDVIAFPKGFEGRDPISGAPSPITESDKKLYHIEVIENEQ